MTFAEDVWEHMHLPVSWWWQLLLIATPRPITAWFYILKGLVVGRIHWIDAVWLNVDPQTAFGFVFESHPDHPFGDFVRPVA